MNDQLDFGKFYRYSKKNIKKPSDYNRLIAHTDNFFLISGYGAFSIGYFLLIPKKLCSSFGEIEIKYSDEINYWINLITKFYNEKLEKDIFLFEHGLCGCLGGLDRAHLHLSPANKNISQSKIIEVVNQIFKRRGVGLKKILYNNVTIDNRYDIELIINKEFNYTITNGKFLNSKEIMKKIKMKFPLGLNEFSSAFKPYNFFYHHNGSFLKDLDVSTQLGREISYNLNNLSESETLKTGSDDSIWKWQIQKFNSNIVKSIKLFKKYLTEQNIKNKKYNIVTS